MAKPVVLIGTPCYGGQVSQGYMESILRLMAYAATHDFDVHLALLGGDSLITRSRNKLVATCLDRPELTHLMFIDADIGFEPEDFHRLLTFDHEVTAAMYPIKNIDWTQMKERLTPDTPEDKILEAGLRFVGLPCKPSEREEREGFVTGTYAGTGFMLIRRSCLERMTMAYPETKFDGAQVFPQPKERSNNQYALFDTLIEPGTNIYLSEDFAFCHRWRQIGGKVWLDPRARLTHFGALRYVGQPDVKVI